MPQPSLRRRAARVRPYLPPGPSPAPPAAPEARPEVLARVLAGLHALPERPAAPSPTAQAPTVQARDERTPLVRHIDAERARTVADRTPTEEIPVVAQGVSWR